MLSGVRFSSLMINSPAGKTQVVKDNKTNRTIVYSNWAVDDLSNPPRVYLTDNNKNIRASYDCTLVEISGKKFPLVDCLDAVASQG
jgi:hypothetical protein